MNITLTHSGLTLNGLTTTFTTELNLEDYGDRYDYEEAVESWQNEIREALGYDEDAEVPYTVDSYEDIPERLMTPIGPEDAFWDYFEAWAGDRIASHTIEMYWAAAALGIPAEEVEESYAGQFRSDEEFALHYADEMSLLDDDLSWPYNCIDWERAASNLMMDFAEENGFYFRNM